MIANRARHHNCIRLCLGLFPRFYVGALYLLKINYFPVSDTVESCTATALPKYWNAIVPSYINEMFKPSYNRYNTKTQIALYIPLRKINTGQQALSFLGPKIQIKTSHSTKNVKTTAPFTYALKRDILNIKQTV